jgi:uncharacterized protein YukE
MAKWLEKEMQQIQDTFNFEDLAEKLESVRSQLEEKADNMEEKFPAKSEEYRGKAEEIADLLEAAERLRDDLPNFDTSFSS